MTGHITILIVEINSDGGNSTLPGEGLSPIQGPCGKTSPWIRNHAILIVNLAHSLGVHDREDLPVPWIDHNY